jgi:hypothetical protein
MTQGKSQVFLKIIFKEQILPIYLFNGLLVLLSNIGVIK